MSILSALHLRNTIFDNIVSLRRALCGLIMIPPWLNTLSTGADVAGTDCTFIASSNSFGNSIMFLFQNSKQSWTSSPHWHMAKYFWYSASVESGCFADEVEVEVGDGIIDENLLTRAKFTSCSALRWLCITQHFKIRVAKFYYFGDCGSATIRRWISRRWATSRPIFFQFTDTDVITDRPLNLVNTTEVLKTN